MLCSRITVGLNLELGEGLVSRVVAPCGHETARIVRGLCLACYQRARRESGLRMKLTPKASRVWSKIDRSDQEGCWPWTATLDSLGYPRVSVKGAMRSARRVVWEMENGPCDKSMDICHYDPPEERLCCRPNHLVERPHFDQRRKGL